MANSKFLSTYSLRESEDKKKIYSQDRVNKILSDEFELVEKTTIHYDKIAT